MKMARRSSSEPRPLAEWITFAIALLIVGVLVVLVVVSWVSQDTQPPIINLDTSGAVRDVNNQFYVPFAVKNIGGGTAESVQIIGELSIDGHAEESGEQQIDFLSGGETREGAFIFTRNPQEGRLVIRVASYKLP